MDKDISDHPHFHMKFLKLVAEFEDSKDIFCENCPCSKFNHVISYGNSYCRICDLDEKVEDCKKFVKQYNEGRMKIQLNNTGGKK